MTPVIMSSNTQHVQGFLGRGIVDKRHARYWARLRYLSAQPLRHGYKRTADSGSAQGLNGVAVLLPLTPAEKSHCVGNSSDTYDGLHVRNLG